MTLKDWRSNKELVEWARITFTKGEWSLLLSVIDSLHPRKDRLPPIASDSVKSTRLGEIYGYDLCLENLLKLAVSPSTTVELEPDFGAAEIMAREKAALTKSKSPDKK